MAVRKRIGVRWVWITSISSTRGIWRARMLSLIATVKDDLTAEVLRGRADVARFVEAINA